MNWGPIGGTDPEGVTSNFYVSPEYVITQDIDDMVLESGPWCIEENEILETPSGQIKAKDLKAGDALYSVDGTNTIQWINRHTADDCYRLYLSNGDSVILTAPHICLTNELRQVKVSDLKIGDVLYKDLVLTDLVKLDEPRTVITIEVDGDHTYMIRNGFYTHNY